jgi:hypothetical protein
VKDFLEKILLFSGSGERSQPQYQKPKKAASVSCSKSKSTDDSAVNCLESIYTYYNKKGGIIHAGLIGYCARFGSTTVFRKNAVV